MRLQYCKRKYNLIKQSEIRGHENPIHKPIILNLDFDLQSNTLIE